MPDGKPEACLKGRGIHGRSGSVALPRAKEGIVAGRAILEMVVRLRRPRALRVVDWRRRVADMLS